MQPGRLPPLDCSQRNQDERFPIQQLYHDCSMGVSFLIFFLISGSNITILTLAWEIMHCIAIQKITFSGATSTSNIISFFKITINLFVSENMFTVAPFTFGVWNL